MHREEIELKGLKLTRQLPNQLFTANYNIYNLDSKYPTLIHEMAIKNKGAYQTLLIRTVAKWEQDERALNQDHSYDSRCMDIPEEVVQSLASNTLPTKSVLEAARVHRMDLALALHGPDEEISTIDQQIKELVQRRYQIFSNTRIERTKLRIFETVMSPIRRLPFDILRKIILFAASDEIGQPSQHCVRIIVSRVCSAWRDAALSLPELWTTLHLNLILKASPLEKSKRQLLEFHRRARGHPIELYLFIVGVRREPLEDTAIALLKSFLQAAAPVSSGLGRLAIGAHKLVNVWHHFSIEGTSWDLSSLTHLHLRDYNLRTDQTSTSLPLTTLFRQAPLLSRFSTAGFALGNPTVNFPFIEWRSMTRLFLDKCIFAFTFLELMDLCPQLKIAQFFIANHTNPELIPRTHSSIDQLAINLISNCSFSSILPKFQMPALRRFTMSGEDDDQESTLLSPSTFMFWDNIQSLTVHGVWDARLHVFIDVLHEALNLEELFLTTPPEAFSAILEAMAFKRGPSHSTRTRSILPRLLVCGIQTTHEWPPRPDEPRVTHYDINVLLRMLESRRASLVPAGCIPLKTFTFRYLHFSGMQDVAEGVVKDILDKTSECKEEGLEMDCTNSLTSIEEEWEPGMEFESWRPQDPDF